MRLFFAVMIPGSLREGAAQLQSSLKEQLPGKGISWVKPENFHYTVRFLGEQPEDRLPILQEAAEEAVSGLRSFCLQPGGLGVFPDVRRPRVLWIGAESGEDAFSELYRRLEESLWKRHLPPGPKEFHAHLTIARVKAAVPELQKTIESVPAKPIGAFEVSRLSLVLSELHPSGSRYTELSGWEF